MHTSLLNIVFIGRPTFPNGGAMTKRHRYFIDYLAKLEHVKVTNIGTWLDEKGSNAETGIYGGSVRYHNTRQPKKLSSIFSISAWCKEILRENYVKAGQNVAVFCSYFSLEQISAMLYAKKLGYRIVCDVVENYDAKGGDSSTLAMFTFRLSQLFFYNKADAFLVISSQIGNVYRRYDKPMLMLTNSAPISSSSVKRHFHEPLSVVYTGTFAPKDGLKYLVEGFDTFVRKYGNVAELRLIGKGSGDEATERIIRDNPQIIKLGFVSDSVLAETQKNADLLCMTRCNSEFANCGFPFKLSEYMATGNAVLATSVGDVPLYIRDKINGLLVPPNSSQAIMDALEYVYADPRRCIEMGARAIRTVEESFSVRTNGEKLYQFLSHL